MPEQKQTAKQSFEPGIATAASTVECRIAYMGYCGIFPWVTQPSSTFGYVRRPAARETTPLAARCEGMNMTVHRISFYVLLVLVTIGFVVVILPFYSAIFWAVILVVIFHPAHLRVEQLVGRRRSLAAALSVLMCVCLVIVPGMLVLSALLQEASSLYQRLDSGEIDIWQALTQAKSTLPVFVQAWLDTLNLKQQFTSPDTDLSSAIMEGGRYFAGRAFSLGQNTLQFFIAFAVMLYLLFFLFRDGRALSLMLRRAIPLSDDHTRQFTAKFASVVRATVRGNIIIALVQGTIGGIAFWALGVQPALLWGVLMTLLALLPVIGAALVWVPAAVYLALTGAWVKVAVLVVIGGFVISLVDNLLRPLLVGKETRMPDYVVLISTIGGISLIGINGFVIGPLFAALFISAWAIFIGERDSDTTRLE
jgi:predicted PurR-regulated permease PerM